MIGLGWAGYIEANTWQRRLLCIIGSALCFIGTIIFGRM